MLFDWKLVIYLCAIINSGQILKVSATGPCILVESVPSSLCIPLDAINEAFIESRHRVGLYEPYKYNGPFLNQHHMDQIDKLGLVLTETTRILATKFSLNHQQIFHFMPKLDLSLTDIWKFCPEHFQHKVCELSRFRTLSGHCNNIRHPDWGATFVPFQNLLPPHHPDGISEPRGYEFGYLPSPRTVSATMHRDAVVHDHAITVMLIAWGQIIDHDITLTGDTKDPYTLKDPECCRPEDPKSGNYHHHNCFPIKIPRNDPFYSHYGQQCMNFARSLTGVRTDCRLGTRKAFNKISSFLDASFIYGSDQVMGSKLRLGKHGLLKSLPIFEEFGLKALLPLKMEEPDDGCIRHNPDVFCFLAGDIRVNEQLVLTVLHTIFMREHNRIAEILGRINSHWKDERIFQETRQIIIAIMQHITFHEFLPMILGKYVMQDYGLILEYDDYWTGYDPTIDPTAAEEFVTSAFRFGHSLLPQKIERWSHGHRFIESEDLHKLIRRPYDVYRPGYVDTFILGMVNQLAQSMDEGVTEQVTTLLFKEPHLPFGMDLAAMNIQRGREHGVPGYTSYREICDLSPISSWEDLAEVMKNDTIYRYKTIYKSPHDIDLWSGGVSELPGKGSLLGPTFSCIIARQFRSLRYGDRFWYELPDLASSFSPDQLREIRGARLSRLLCDNSDDLKTVQIYAMVLPDDQVNPRVPCRADIIPRIDFEKWREIPGVTDVTELDHNHFNLHYPEHEHQSYPNDYTSFEYQHEYGVDEVSSAPAPHAHVHAYGTGTGHGYTESQSPPVIRVEDIHITTAAPPTVPHPDTSGEDASQQNENNKEFPAAKIYVDDHHHHHHQHQKSNHPTKPNKIEPTKPRKPYAQMEASIEYGHDEHSYTYARPPAPSLPAPASVRRKNTKVHATSKGFVPFPESPFPGWSGIFSPNPGYLVKQRFQVYRPPPAYVPPAAPSKGKGIWKGIG